jgi:predicted RNase H-like nuclease (RuvC/YqgF family)
MGVVNKLVEGKDYVHAISLLAAMQIHDKSEDLQALVQKVINSAPLEIIKALQDSQKQIVELEGEKTHLASQIKEKDTQIDKITKELESSKSQLESSKSQLAATKENLERIQKERDELSIKLKGFSAQLSEVHKTIDKLETEIESVKELGGRGVVVNFGYGWAIYGALKSEPYIIRDGERLPARKGLVLKNGDVIYDADGHQIEEYLPSNSIVIRPNQESYQDVINYLNGNG